MSTKKGGLGRNLDALIPTPIKLAGTSTPIASLKMTSDYL